MEGLNHLQNEVQLALKMKSARDVAGIPPQDAEDTLRQRYQALHALSHQHHQATTLSTAISARLSGQASQLKRIISSLEPELLARTQKRQRRRQDIFRHVSQHLRDVDAACAVKMVEASAAAEELAELSAKEREMREQIAELAEKVGWEGEGVPDLDGIERWLKEVKSEGEVDETDCMF